MKKMKNELKVNELRIGNLVKSKVSDNDFLEVEEMAKKGDLGYYLSFKNKYASTWMEFKGQSIIEPIPLTEELLLKFGFEYQNEDYKYWMSISVPNQKTRTRIFIVIRDKEDECRFHYNRYGDGKELDCPKYVHQLQNLYFALTGEELELK